ncbi:hypothetical protein [Streptomyces sp. NBC_00057]|uniref:hypothetical protein n=1 Tax=Streptomyces sp. NBC_00057 TaxID=2975634 RepID=UPI00324BEF4E
MANGAASFSGRAGAGGAEESGGEGPGAGELLTMAIRTTIPAMVRTQPAMIRVR